MKTCWIKRALCLIWAFAMMVLLLPGGTWAQASAKKPSPFRPDVERIIPIVGETHELALLKAGKPEERWKRAMELRQSLPELGTISPIDKTNDLISWLAVTIMMEGAVVSSGTRAPESWEQELAALYRRYVQLEDSFQSFRSAMTVVSIQKGGEFHPLVKLSRQLSELSGYSRQGFRWLAARCLKDPIGKDLRQTLLEGLVEIDRRERQWEQMQKDASALEAVQGSGKASTYQAEAWFELGQIEKGQKVLSSLSVKLTDPELEKAKRRQELAVIRADGPRLKSPEGMTQTAELLIGLDEPERITAMFSAPTVLLAKNSKLNELFIEALMRNSLDFQGAWEFGKKAVAFSPTPGFLGRHIGAGLLLFLRQFYGSEGQMRGSALLLADLDQELLLFEKEDAKLASLTRMFIGLMQYLADQTTGKTRLAVLSEAVSQFCKKYPEELAGVQLAYLLFQLGAKGQDPWVIIEQYQKQVAGKPLPDDFLPVLVGASIRRTLELKLTSVAERTLVLVDEQMKAKKPAWVQLLRAHLLAARSLVSLPQETSSRLQEAVSAYQDTIKQWGSSEGEQRSLDVLCDAASSLATVMMESQDVANAKVLLDQVAPVCGKDPTAQAVSAILSLVGGSGQGAGDPRKILEQTLEGLPSQQAKIQSLLWLAMIAESSSNAAAAQPLFAKAAQMLQEERARGAHAVLAPDLRALVAFSGSFNMQTGYAPNNPFGLAISVGVNVRMTLFPPAAVSEAKLAPWLTGLASPAKRN